MAKHPRKSIRSQLQGFRKDEAHVSIWREPLDPHSMFAFVVDIGDELVLLMDVTDLSADGFKIVRLRDVSRIDRRGSEKWFEQILRQEGIVKAIKAPFQIDLSTWKSAIADIKAHLRKMVVEDEDPDDDLYVIGEVKRLNAQTVSIRHFDPVGHWERSDRVIPYSRITAVTFDDRYTTLCSKYVGDPR
jgi:hypothetical protein